MLAQPAYAADFAELRRICRERGVALQTIKSIARRRWQDDQSRKFSWYEPLRDPDAIRRAVHFVLGHDDVFLNTSSDATLLASTLAAAHEFVAAPAADEMDRQAERHDIEPLFVPGVLEDV